ncbi:MAG: hypothetical protein WBD65_11740, partial [Methylocella sp.]
LKDLLKEGFGRATVWLHVLAAMFAFTGDFLTKIFPYCRETLAILGFAAAAFLFFSCDPIPQSFKMVCRRVRGQSHSGNSFPCAAGIGPNPKREWGLSGIGPRP